MSHFTSFAVAGGSGMMGSSIVAGLLAANPGRVVVLSRSAETNVPEGAEVKAVNFDSTEDVEQAIAGIDVVICTLRDSQSTQEPLLARACKSVGTKLFVPSEFGCDLTGSGPNPMSAKVAIAALVAELEQPSLKVFTGAWFDTTFLPNRFGFDFTKGEVEIVGTGDEPWSFTSVADTGKFLGTLLTSLPPSELASLGSVSIEGSHHTLNQVVALYEAAHPEKAKLHVRHTPLAASERFVNKCEGFAWFTRSLVNLWAQPGPGSADVTFGGKVKLANELVPKWKPQSLADYFAEMKDQDSYPAWTFYDTEA